ncbi:inverse autotransporter beta domain-containing protein, partial [Vibrio mediterranei]|uniref:inverse autotransporter beta domain-containing protein n=1 Tax=Vibrio mediterranei TaxID=689 RepID=UPI001EFD8135
MCQFKSLSNEPTPRKAVLGFLVWYVLQSSSVAYATSLTPPSNTSSDVPLVVSQSSPNSSSNTADYIHLYYGHQAPTPQFEREVLSVSPELKLFLWKHDGVYHLMGKSAHLSRDLLVLQRQAVPDAYAWKWLSEKDAQQDIKHFKKVDKKPVVKPSSVHHASQFEMKTAQVLTQVGQSDDRKSALTSALKSEAKSYAEGEVSSLVEQSLGSFGTVDVGVQLSENFQPKSGHLEWMVPFLTTKASTWLVQSGGVLNDETRYEGRDFAHIGVGYRHLMAPNAMLGVNGFYDLDVTRGHQRGSIGAEQWLDNYKLTENYYFPLSGWKSSSKTVGSQGLYDLDERAVSSVDIKGEGYIPSHPSWSADVRYEQKMGALVATSDNGTPQSNPYTLSADVNYQPIPLVKLSAGYEEEKGVGGHVKLGLNLQYKFGESFDKQVSATQVGVDKGLTRQMTTSLVQRNANIGLEYRENAFAFEVDNRNIHSHEGQTLSMSDYVSLHGPKNVESFTLTISGDTSVTSTVQTQPTLSGLRYVVPMYDKQHANRTLLLTAHLKSGKRVSAPSIHLTIQPKARSRVDLAYVEVTKKGATAHPGHSSILVTRDNAQPDGKQADTITVTLKDKQGQVLSNQSVLFDVKKTGATLSTPKLLTNTKGQAVAKVSSTQALTVPVNVTIQGLHHSVLTHFVLGKAQTFNVPKLTFGMSPFPLKANGQPLPPGTTCKSSDSSILAVGTTCTLTPKKAGGPVNLTVTIPGKVPSIIAGVKVEKAVGTAANGHPLKAHTAITDVVGKTGLSAAATGGNGHLHYAVSPTTVATIDNKGVLKLLKPGLATVTVTDDGDVNHKKQSQTTSVTVLGKAQTFNAPQLTFGTSPFPLKVNGQSLPPGTTCKSSDISILS